MPSRLQRRAGMSPWVSIIGLVLVALVMAACGEGGDDTEDSGTPDSDTGNGDSASIDEFRANAEQVVAEASSTQDASGLPTTSPPIAEDRMIVSIPATMVGESCNRTASTVVEAAELVGWDALLIDPDGDPSAYGPAVRQAIAAGADAIVICAIDSNNISAALAEAVDEGVHVIAAFSADPEGLFEYTWPEQQEIQDYGYALAAAGYLHNDGRLNAVLFEAREFTVTHWRQDGTELFIEECEVAGGDCSKLASTNILVTDLATTAPQQAVSLVEANQEADTVWTAHDPMMLAVQPALEAAGLTEDRIGLAFDGNSPNLANIRAQNFQVYDVGAPMEWVAYAQVDTLNRLFQGEELVEQGARLKLLTPDNAPQDGDWPGDVDVAPLYGELWGLD